MTNQPEHPEEEEEGMVDGRFIQEVSEYASTCDGCSELTMHDKMEIDEETQLGYCEVRVDKRENEKKLLNKESQKLVNQQEQIVGERKSVKRE